MKQPKTHARMPHVLALAVVLLVGGPSLSAVAQSFSLGADLVSRYVWRGTDFGESASIQPALAFSHNGFEVGTWASYAVDPASAGDNEHDLWVSYTAGNFSLGVTDYYFPNAGAGFLNFDGDGNGAHYIEPFVALSGPESFPIALYAGYFAYNDPDQSIYVAATYPVSVDGVDLSFTAGASPTESALYGTTGFGIVELNLMASKAVPLTDSFALPISVAYILNPYAERSYLVFGLSF